MSWNRASSEVPEKKKAGSAGKTKGVVALCIVVLGAIAAYLMLTRDEPISEKVAEKKTSSIKEVSPVTQPKPQPEVPKEPIKEKHDSRYDVPEGAYRDERGILRTPTGRRILEQKPTRFLSTRRSDRPRVFGSSAEEDIAKLILIKPGDVFMPGNYGPRFLQSFKKSLTQPTLVLSTDSEETKELKRQVNEVKADLKAKLDAGEDIAKIMQDTENELRALSVYKKDLLSEVKALRMDENISEADFQDYVDAANKMLKERGMDEIKLPKIHEARLQQLRETYKARQEAKAAEAASKNAAK